MLTGVKVFCFCCFAILLFNSSLIVASFHSSGLILVVAIIAWCASGIAFDRFKSKSKLATEGKSVLITGCDTGFGHEIALHLNDVGFTVFAGCLFKDRAAAQSLLSKCKNRDKMHVLAFDVTSEADITKVHDLIQKHTESSGENLYSIVNNAGISGWAPLEWGTMEHDVELTIEVDMTAVMKITRIFMPMLRKSRKSRIVFLTSYINHVSIPMLIPYAVAKNGVKAFADTLRAEVFAEAEFYNDMKILNLEPTAYKTPLVGYNALRTSIDRTWDRTSACIKQAYGHEIYEGFCFFLSTCQFFEWFDFVSFRTNLNEVAVAVESVIRSEDPADNSVVMGSGSAMFYAGFRNYVPDEIMEMGFNATAAFLIVYGHGVTLIKPFFTALASRVNKV